jgi:hypothetical protein
VGGVIITADGVLTEPPEFDDLTWLKARSCNRYEPMFFEWFRFVGQLTWFTYSISEESQGFRNIESVDLKVLQGMLNRCSRLMLSHMALSHEHKFGETTAILDRCIFETSVKVRWICSADDPEDRFRRFKADGLKNDLKLKREIDANIEARGSAEPIEERMLRSISNYVALSGLSEDEVEDTQKQPNLRAMMEDIGLSDLSYVVFQNLGSHHVHGTWSSLLLHYLEPDFEAKTLELRDHDCMADQNTYAATALMVLKANRDYLDFVLREGSEEFRDDVIGLMDDTYAEIFELLREAGETKTRLHQGAWFYLTFNNPLSSS